MSEPSAKALTAIKGLQTVAFMLPAVLTGVAVGLVVSSYQPLALEEDAGSAAAVELETLDGNEASEEASVDTGDLSLDLSNIADGTYTGSAQGFQSTITVQVTVKDHKITAIEVLSQGDTEAYFNRAKAVIDKVLSAQSLDVDTVSGATYSSRGILMAIKNALGLATDAEANSGGGGGTSSASGSPASDTGYTPGALKDGVYEGSEMGFNDYITVRVTISGGKITAIDVVSQNDTAEYFNRATGVISSIISAQSTNVDAVSGATYSSEGIKGAVKNALLKAGADDSSSDSSNNNTNNSDNNSNNNSSNSGNNSSDNSGDNKADDDTTVKYADGDYTAYALCENGDDFTPYYVGLTITVKDGKVTAIKDVHGTGKATDADEDLGEFDEDNQSYLDNAINGRTFRGSTYTGVIEQLLNGKTSSNFDVVARATYSSKAIASAYDKALALSAAEYKKQNSTATCGCPGCTGENCCCTTNSGDSSGDSDNSGTDNSGDSGSGSDSGDSGSTDNSGSEASGDGSSGTEGTGSDTSSGDVAAGGAGGGSQ